LLFKLNYIQSVNYFLPELIIKDKFTNNLT
jgi:hypothetical protein